MYIFLSCPEVITIIIIVIINESAGGEYEVVISHLISCTTSIYPGDNDGAALDFGKSRTTNYVIFAR